MVPERLTSPTRRRGLLRYGTRSDRRAALHSASFAPLLPPPASPAARPRSTPRRASPLDRASGAASRGAIYGGACLLGERSLPRAIAPHQLLVPAVEEALGLLAGLPGEVVADVGVPADLYGETATTSASTPIRVEGVLEEVDPGSGARSPRWSRAGWPGSRLPRKPGSTSGCPRGPERYATTRPPRSLKAVISRRNSSSAAHPASKPRRRNTTPLVRPSPEILARIPRSPSRLGPVGPGLRRRWMKPTLDSNSGKDPPPPRRRSRAAVSGGARRRCATGATGSPVRRSSDILD